MGRRSDGRRRESATSSKMIFFNLPGPKNIPSLIFGAGITKTPDLPPSRPEESEEWRIPSPSSSFKPLSINGFQLPSAMLRSGSSARSSILKIGPKIKISPLLQSRRLSWSSIRNIRHISFSRSTTHWSSLSQAGRGRVAHGGAAGQSGTEQDETLTGRQPYRLPSWASKTTVLNLSSEARTNNIPRYATHREIKRPVDGRYTNALLVWSRTLFVPGCWPVDRRLFAFVNPFHARRFQDSHRLCNIRGYGSR